MELKRRGFLRAVLAAPFLWAAQRCHPTKWIEALRARAYPGPRKPLEHADVARPGRWVG